MKLPHVTAALILAVAALWTVQGQQNLTSLRARHAALISEASQLGISTHDASSPASPTTKSSRRQRPGDARDISRFADQLLALASEMKTFESSGNPPDDSMKKRSLAMMDELLALNGREIRQLIELLRSREGLDDEIRQNMVNTAVMMLAQQHPSHAIALFTDSPELFPNNEMGQHVFSTTLTRWAQEEPLAAVDWLRKNAEKHPERVNDQAKNAVIQGAAQQDFTLAFQLADELGVKESTHWMHLISHSSLVHNPERQNEFLTALRQHAAAIEDTTARGKFVDQGLGTVFSAVTQSGFEKSTAWLDSAQLSTPETEKLVRHLHYHNTKADTGQWLDWIAQHGGKEQSIAETTSSLMRNWTSNDYQAAGQWLASSPPGPQKETAVLAYIQTVAPYDAEAATQWAETLPPEKRQQALQSIQQSKPAQNH